MKIKQKKLEKFRMLIEGAVNCFLPSGGFSCDSDSLGYKHGHS